MDKIFNDKIWELLEKETTKISDKALDELNEERILYFIEYNNVFYTEENRYNPPTNQTWEYLKKLIKRELGLSYYIDYINELNK